MEGSITLSEFRSIASMYEEKLKALEAIINKQDRELKEQRDHWRKWCDLANKVKHCLYKIAQGLPNDAVVQALVNQALSTEIERGDK